MAEMEKKRICPYNPAHYILEHRFQTHITRCKSQHLLSGYQECPFSAMHIFKPADREKHVATCSDRHVYDRVVSTTGNVCVQSLDAVNVPVSSSEDWDDSNVSSYLCVKDELLEGTKIIRNVQCNQGKAAKRDHYIREKERHTNLMEQEKAETPVIPGLPSTSGRSRGRGRGVRTYFN